MDYKMVKQTILFDTLTNGYYYNYNKIIIIIRIQIQSLLSCKKHSNETHTHHSYVYVNSICIYAKYMHMWLYICESEVA